MSRKIYLNYQGQIEKLKADGLEIPDERRALARLKWEGYYNFAVGYNRLFKDQNKRYVKGTRFEHIEALYDYDKHLRAAVYEYAQSLETTFKALVADEFSKRHGVDEKRYLSEACFTDEEADRGSVRWMIATCKEALEDGVKPTSRGYRDYIAHYYKAYGHVPLWVLVRALSFGNTLKFYELMKGEEKREIALEFGVSADTLSDLLDVAVAFRNFAAHGERVYCARLPVVRLDSELSAYRKIGVPRRVDGTPRYGTNDFFALVIAFKYLLSPREFSAFLARVKAETQELEKELPAFAIERVYEATGLRGNWKNLDGVRV